LRRNKLLARVAARRLPSWRKLPPPTYYLLVTRPPRRRHLRLRPTRPPPRRRTILRRNKISLPPTSTWTRGLNRSLRLLMSTWAQEPNKMPQTPAHPSAALGLLMMPAQATGAPAQITKERALQCRRSGLLRNLPLLAKLHRPRRNNPHSRLPLLRRLQHHPRPLPRPRPSSQTRPLLRSSPAPSRSSRPSPAHHPPPLLPLKQRPGPALPCPCILAGQQPGLATGPASSTRRNLRAASP
jgi:hypothetical protein